jgi:hypothetical protein
VVVTPLLVSRAAAVPRRAGRNVPPSTRGKYFCKPARLLLFLNLVHKRGHECVYAFGMLPRNEIAIYNQIGRPIISIDHLGPGILNIADNIMSTGDFTVSE